MAEGAAAAGQGVPENRTPGQSGGVFVARVGGRVVVCLWCVCEPSPAALQGGPYRVAADEASALLQQSSHLRAKMECHGW